MRGLAVLLLVCYLAALGAGWLAIARGGEAGIRFWRNNDLAEGALIRTVLPNSAADQAGIRPGDLLIEVNGVAARDQPTGLLSVLYRQRAGEQSTWKVLRPGSSDSQVRTTVVTLQPRLAQPDILFDVVVVSIVSLLTLAVPLVVALARPRDPSARLLLGAGVCFTVLLLLAVWSSGYYEVWLEAAIYLSFVLACASLLHLFLVFPAPHPLLLQLRARDPRARWQSSAATALLYVVPLLVTLGIITSSAIHAAWAWLVGTILLFGAIAAIARSFHQPPTPLARAQLKWILWSLLVCVATILVVLIPPLATNGEVLVASPAVAAMALGLFPIALGVAVLRYRLFDVNAVLRATLVYPILAITLVAGYLAVAFAVRGLLSWLAGPGAADSLLDDAVAALAVAAVAHGARERLQTLLDHLVYRERLARRRLLEEAADTLSRPQEPATVAAFLTDHAAQQLELRGAWLALTAEARPRATGLAAPLPGDPAALLQALQSAPGPRLLVAAEELVPGSERLLLANTPGLAVWLSAGARVVVPLRTGEARPAGDRSAAPPLAALLGVWVLGGRESGELFDDEDLRVLGRIGDQAAVLFDYARLNDEHLQQAVIRSELSRAREIQQRLLPPRLPGWPGELELAARFRPARETSGDFYDAFPLASAGADGELPDDAVVPLQITVGDVAGKSIPAALVMALARTILRAVAQRGAATDTPALAIAGGRGGAPVAPAVPPDPATTMRLTGRLLHQDVGRRDFVACALAVLEPAGAGRAGPRLHLVNAAQVPPILCRAGRALELEPPGDRLPLGVVPDPQYEALTLDLQPGDVVVFTSDGLPEAPSRPSDQTAAPDPGPGTLDSASSTSCAPHYPPAATLGEMFGFERLAASAAYWTAHGEDAEAIAAGIWADLTGWCGEDSAHDDMTLLVLRVLPRPSAGNTGAVAVQYGSPA